MSLEKERCTGQDLSETLFSRLWTPEEGGTSFSFAEKSRPKGASPWTSGVVDFREKRSRDLRTCLDTIGGKRVQSLDPYPQVRGKTPRRRKRRPSSERPSETFGVPPYHPCATGHPRRRTRRIKPSFYHDSGCSLCS